MSIKSGNELGISGAGFNKIAATIEQDIDDSKYTYNELKELELLNPILFERSPDGVLIIDPKTLLPLMFNDAACKLLGYSREEFSLMHISDYETTETPEKTNARIEKILRDGGAVYETKYHTKTGEIRCVLVTVQTIKLSGRSVLNVIFRDITEQKQAEEKLRESEESHRRLVNFSPYGIAIHSMGKIVYMNIAGASILGSASPEQFIGKNVFEIIHPDYHNIVRERIQVQETGKAAPPIEEVFVRVDGTSVDVEITSIPLKYEGKPAMYGVFKDITERKRNEEMRLENIRLEEADKAKGEFLASMSHELRTPLSASIGFSELLKQGTAGELNEKQYRYIDNIIESNKFLLILINDILDLSKIEAGKIELVKERISLPLTLKETLSLIKEKAMKHNVLLKTEFDPELEFINADKQRLKQIMFNLLSNAVKFRKEEGGTVTITTKKEGNMAQISVSDTGIGIREENINKLFHKFEQLEPGITSKYGGTGLGLAITKQLIEMHGGNIRVDSRYGEGTTFIFSIPVET